MLSFLLSLIPLLFSITFLTRIVIFKVFLNFLLKSRILLQLSSFLPSILLLTSSFISNICFTRFQSSGEGNKKVIFKMSAKEFFFEKIHFRILTFPMILTASFLLITVLSFTFSLHKNANFINSPFVFMTSFN